jgi:tetratricopeptide (TPR) repeat protein
VDGAIIYQWTNKNCFDVDFDPRRKCIACYGRNGEVIVHESQTLDDQGLRRRIYIAQQVNEELPANPYQMQLMSRRILLEEEKDSYPEALALVTEATNLVPGCKEYEFTKGVALFRAGQLESAIQVLSRLDELDWNFLDVIEGTITTSDLDVYSHAVRAMAHQGIGHYEQAQEQLTLAKQADETVASELTARILLEAENIVSLILDEKAR